MTLVIMLPNTARLKQLIKSHGNVWEQVGRVEPKQCFGNDEGMMIESLDKEHSRNIRVTDVKPGNPGLKNRNRIT